MTLRLSTFHPKEQPLHPTPGKSDVLTIASTAEKAGFCSLPIGICSAVLILFLRGNFRFMTFEKNKNSDNTQRSNHVDNNCPLRKNYMTAGGIHMKVRHNMDGVFMILIRLAF